MRADVAREPTPGSWTRRCGHVVGLFVAYAATVVALTWPLAPRIGTHIPNLHVSSEYDGLFLTWALAHETRAFGTAAFPHGNVFHPAPHALFYGETGFGMLPYFAPTFLATGNAIAALNVAVLVSVALGALGLHLVAAGWTGSQLAGCVAAWTFLMTRWVLPGGIAGAPNYAVLQYFPAVIWLTARPATTGRGAALLLLAVTLQGLTSAYMASAVLAPVAVLAIARVLRPATRRSGLRLGLVAGASLALLAAAYAGHATVRGENPGLAQQSFFVGLRQAADLPWGPLSYWTPTAVPAVALLLIAAVGALAVVRGLPRGIPGHAWTSAAFWTAIGLVLALPPVGRLAGHDVRLPASLVPGVYDLIRVPDRLGVPALFGLALLAGLSFATCTRRMRAAARTALALVVAAGMLVEYLRGPELPVLREVRTHTYLATVQGFPPNVPVPRDLLIRPHLDLLAYPLLDVGHLVASPLLATVAQSPGATLELPTGPEPAGLPTLQARAMLRSIVHRRPLLNGYSRYYPASFPAIMALANRLPARDAVDELVRRTGLSTVLVHLDQLPAPARLRWLDATSLRDAGVRLVAQDGADALFGVAR